MRNFAHNYKFVYDFELNFSNNFHYTSSKILRSTHRWYACKS